MKNKLLSAMLVISMMFALSACGSKNEEKPENTIQAGQKITIDGFCDYEIKEAMIFDTVKDDGISLEADEGMKNFCLLANVKNLGSNKIRTSECIDVDLVFNNNQKYDDVIYSAIGEGFSANPELTPLKDNRLYCTIQIPEAVAAQPENLKLTIKLKDKSHIYSSSIVPVYDYVAKVSALADRYYTAFSEFSDLIQYKIPFETNMSRAVNKILTTATANKSEIDAIINELSGLQPPSCYQEGYDALKQHLSMYNEVMTELSDSSKANNPDTYTEVGDKLQDSAFVSLLETAVKNMTFLKDTKLRNMID